MIVNLANVLTCTRLIMAPFVFFAIIAGRDYLVLALLLASALTDMADGWAARRMGQVTALGTVLDPIADKLFVAGTLLGGVLAERLPSWLAWTYLAKEGLQLALGAVFLARRRTPIKANLYGKAATTITVSGFILVWLGWRQGWQLVLAGLGVGAWAGLTYFRLALAKAQAGR